MKSKVDELIKQMTLEEKAGLCSGKDNWYLKGVERLGIPSVMVSDGPHGLRVQRNETDHLGLNDSIPAVCFPAACATAASFDTELLKSMGETLGQECNAEDVSVLLGPAVNIKRSPLCGRNFEYFSEDPYLTGELAASYTKGIQSQGVGVSVKHFAANNQETRRMTVSADIDERTFREIYLAGFETIVKKAKPQTIMCSYNKINGVQVSENKYLLTDILRDEWGFDGYVMSDWGAVVDRIKGLKAGLDLEMPNSGGHTDAQIVKAVKSGELDEKVLDTAVARILNIILTYAQNKAKVKKDKNLFDLEKHHKVATDIARECIVLLKNDENILPLAEKENILFAGEFAFNPRFQGGGSSHINSFKTTSAAECAKNNANITVVKGYSSDKAENEKRIAEAVSLAKKADKAVLFVGLPDSFESEGYDRQHMSMPDYHNELISAVTKVNKNTIVVLHNGSPVEMPWLNDVKAVLEVYLGGQGIGEATVDVLYGKTNPSGKLPETFPIKLSDNPSYLYFPGDEKSCKYAEGVFVGYRYYDKKQMNVLFPFGHGLSYTNFTYSNLKVSKHSFTDGETVKVTVDVKNTGKLSGKEVVQLYIKDNTNRVSRPVKELKGFAKILLSPNETKTIEFTLDKRSFAYYNEAVKDWAVSSGEYEILIGKSSQDIVLSKAVTVKGQELPFVVTRETTMGELLNNEKTKPFVLERLKNAKEKFGGKKDDGEEKTIMGIDVNQNLLLALVSGMPLRGIKSFMAITDDQLDQIIEKLNLSINLK